MEEQNFLMKFLKSLMLDDPQTLVIPDGTEVIRKEQYKEQEYERVFFPKSVIEI